MPVTNEPADGYEQAGYNQCKNMKTRTRNGRGEPVDVVNYMHQNFRAAKRPPEDPVGGTIRDLSEHYDKCLEGGGKREPRSFALPKFPPGDPRNDPPKEQETQQPEWPEAA